MTVPHRAQFYNILWIEKGHGVHYIDFNPIDIEDDTIIFVPDNCVNMFDISGDYQGKLILFTNSFFCKNNQDIKYIQSSLLFSDFYSRSRIKGNLKESELARFLEAMEKEFLRKHDDLQYNLLHHMLHVFLLKAECEMQKQGFQALTPSADLDSLILFKEMLEIDFRLEKSVNKYASKLCISEKQLHKATTKLLDKTLKQLISERVLLEAKRLLAHGNQSIKEIAYELAY